MSKKRSPSRLLSLLSKFGYELGYVNDVEGTFTFTKTRGDGLYELISCSFAGKERDAAVCRVGASVTRIVPLKKLTEKTVVVDIASVPDRGWTIIESDEDLRRWEQDVAQVAVPIAERFGNDLSATLCERTRETREAVRNCIVDLLVADSQESCLASLKSRASQTQLHLASRLAECPGVQQVIDATEIYEISCLAVVVCVRPNDLPDPSNPDEMPLENDRLMWEIQLIADRLLDKKLRNAVSV